MKLPLAQTVYKRTQQASGLRAVLFLRGMLLCLAWCAAGMLQAQNSEVDSLRKALGQARHDTTKCRILYEMVEREVDDNVWPRYNISLQLMAQYNLRKYKKGHPLHNVFRKYQAAAINNIGYLHSLRGDVYHALEYYYRALHMQQEIKDRSGEATTYNNLGSVFDDLGEPEKAFEYYSRSYEIQRQINDKPGMAIAQLNMGFYYDNKGLEREALEHYLQSLHISQEIQDEQGQVYTLNNISLTYLGFKDYGRAIAYATQAMQLSLKSDYTEGLAFSYNCLGNAFLEKGQYREAENYGLKSYEIGAELGFPATIGNAAQLLSEVYEKTGRHEKALAYYKTRVRMRDSISNEQNKKISIKKQFQVEYAKKAAADSMKVLEEKRIERATFEAREQKKRTERYALYGGFALVLVFAVFIFNRFRVTKKQSRIIALKEKEARYQRNLVESKQKEIIDSINYARRIQNAILARESDIRRYFPQSFLLYKPKDIVAGDFYFFETTATHVFYAAADCTGHGVPGALVSVVCSNALSRCVKEFGLTDPGKILDKTRELVLETLRKSGEAVKDGMDISLVAVRLGELDRQGPVSISWAGANNPLWILEKGQETLKEIKPDKQPIGLVENPQPFTTHTLQLDRGAQIILFTDGYADQFGGPKGKKFKYKNLGKLLQQYRQTALPDQAELLDRSFEEWRGTLEQVDDVCVIGVRF